MIRYCDEYWEDVDRVLDSIPNLNMLCHKSILITGGSGMICSSVVDLLLRYNQTKKADISIILAGRNYDHISKRFEPFTDKKDYEFVSYDATKQQDLDCYADYIIHGASNANPAIYTKEPVETILANIVGLNDLLSMAVNNNSQRVLYISSSEVYGNKTSIDPYKEEDYGFVDILNSRSCYPCSKRTAETLCVAYSQEHNLDTVIVRPGHIYGPTITDSDSRASAQFTRNAVNGEDIVMKSAGDQLRSYCYTLDCASAILTVLLNGEKENAYNISNKDSVVSIRDMAEALANEAGRKVIYEQPTDVEKQGYNPMSNSSLDAQKLESLGWKALFNLKEGAEKTIKYYR